MGIAAAGTISVGSCRGDPGGAEMSSKAAIDFDRAALADFCQRHHIRKLSLFGSVLRDDFRSDSDVDVLIEFEEDAHVGLFKYFRIQEELERLLGRPVDMVERGALRNPFRRHEILKTAKTIYAA
jgi:uncharacterized protein